MLICRRKLLILNDRISKFQNIFCTKSVQNAVIKRANICFLRAIGDPFTKRKWKGVINTTGN